MYDLTGGNAYFSENLGTWTPATTYLDGAYIIKNQDVNGADYLLKSDGTVVQVSTGLAGNEPSWAAREKYCYR